MQTSSYEDWMTRPLSAAVCPTPDIWPDDAPPDFRRRLARRHEAPSDSRRHLARPYSNRKHSVVLLPHRNAHPTDTLDRETMMNEEKMRILKMLEDKRITADQAVKLLDALDRTDSRPTDRELRRKWLHIRVEKDGRQTVNLKVPLALLKFGFKFAPQGRARRHERLRASHEQAMARAERAKARAEKMRAKIERRMRDKFGDEVEINLNGVIDEALEEAGLGVPPVPPVPPVHGSPVDDILNGDFDLDLDRILEMAQDASFDGKVLDVYDDEEDEHVRITLE
jgi:hypothetical protein